MALIHCDEHSHTFKVLVFILERQQSGPHTLVLQLRDIKYVQLVHSNISGAFPNCLDSSLEHKAGSGVHVVLSWSQ